MLHVQKRSPAVIRRVEMEKWPVNTLKNKFKEQHMSFE